MIVTSLNGPVKFDMVRLEQTGIDTSPDMNLITITSRALSGMALGKLGEALAVQTIGCLSECVSPGGIIISL